MSRVFLLSEDSVVSLSSHILANSCNYNVTHMGTLTRVPTNVYLVPHIDSLIHPERKTQIQIHMPHTSPKYKS